MVIKISQKYSQWNMSVPTVNIQKPRRFQVVIVNRINNCCPSYVKRARTWPNRYCTVHNQNYQNKLRERANERKSKSSRIRHVLCHDHVIICFRLAKESHSSLFLDCIVFFCQMQSEWKTSWKKEATNEKKLRKRTTMTYEMDTKTRRKAFEKA